VEEVEAWPAMAVTKLRNNQSPKTTLFTTGYDGYSSNGERLRLQPVNKSCFVCDNKEMGNRCCFVFITSRTVAKFAVSKHQCSYMYACVFC